MARRRTSRHNPWAAAKPANWGSMTRQQRKAWNRANWQRGGGAMGPWSPTPKERAANKALIKYAYDEVKSKRRAELSSVKNNQGKARAWLRDHLEDFHDALYGEGLESQAKHMMAMARAAGMTPAQVMEMEPT